MTIPAFAPSESTLQVTAGNVRPLGLWRRVPARLRPALLSLALNLPLAVAGVHRTAYDTYTHIFLADHYRLHWFELREFRWYGGFSVASYPPLVHQLIALLSWPLSALAGLFAPPAPLAGVYRYRGEELAYVLVLLAALAALPYAVERFARIFVGPRAARWTGYLSLACPAVGLAGWSFGQLPTLCATVMFLFALAEGDQWLRQGRRPALLRALAWAGAAAAAHHAALLFALFAGVAVTLQVFIYPRQTTKKTRSHGEKESTHRVLVSWCPAGAAIVRACDTNWGRGLRVYPLVLRLIVWAGLSAAVVIVVLWPFLEWSAGYQAQAPIDHATRHNYLLDPIVSLTFFWPVYGLLLLGVPWALAAAWRLPRLRALGALFVVFFALGLGGTTPLPRWLFGLNWEWLTYDRFALWAALCLLPFAGAFLTRHRQHFITSPLRPFSSAPLRFILHSSLFILSFLFGSLLSVVTRAQPPALNLVPVDEFLNEGANDQWRYLTLGFGDQAARLATLTTAGTPDGAYHTAREIPDLKGSGFGQLDGLVWQPAGAEGLRPFLQKAAGPEGWSVRWIFVAHPNYEPVLRETGWRFDRQITGGIALWTKDRVWPVAPWTLEPSGRSPSARWWGTVPLVVFALAAGLGLMDDRRLRRASLFGRAALIATLAMIIPIGWHEIVRVTPSPGVFLAYKGVLVFANDTLLLVLLIAWLVERWLFPAEARPLRYGPRLIGWGWLALLAAVGLSLPRSADPALTLAFLLHLALLGGMYLYLQTEPRAWSRVAWLLIVQLALQAVLGIIEFGEQSTAILGSFHLPFLGEMSAAVPGASVVQMADGTRWLRAYGTLWHPNVLGAVLLVSLGGPVLLLFNRESRIKGN